MARSTRRSRDAEPAPLDVTLRRALARERPLGDLVPHLLRRHGVRAADRLAGAYERLLLHDRPAARRAGGVYHTPARVAAYMVAEGLGPLLRGGARAAGAPACEGAPLVLDPACGAGPFLLCAYRALLAHHQARAPDRRLSFAERARILREHIHGVDLDGDAVLVAHLSLLVELYRTGRGRAPPAPGDQAPCLGRNVVCGDALAGDFALWFPEAAARGGFDVVLCNPPYLGGVAGRTRLGGAARKSACARFASARGTFDGSILFQELGLRLLRAGGRACYIVPNKFLSAPFGAAFRRFAQERAELLLLADLQAARLFPGVAIYPVVYALVATPAPRPRYQVQLHTFGPAASGPLLRPLRRERISCAPAGLLTWGQLLATSDLGLGLLARLREEHPPLGRALLASASATTREAYCVQPFLIDQAAPPEAVRLLTSGAIERYRHHHGRAALRYLHARYQAPFLPLTCPHLSSRRREQYRSEKLIVASMTRRLEAVWDDGGAAGAVATVQLLRASPGPTLKYELGLLNSTLLSWVFRRDFATLALQGGHLRIGAPQLRTLPLRAIDFGDPADRERHERMIELVERMMALSAELHAPARPGLKDDLRATDAAIDALVYELYRLSPADVRLVESAGARAAQGGAAATSPDAASG